MDENERQEVTRAEARVLLRAAIKQYGRPPHRDIPQIQLKDGKVSAGGCSFDEAMTCSWCGRHFNEHQANPSYCPARLAFFVKRDRAKAFVLTHVPAVGQPPISQFELQQLAARQKVFEWRHLQSALTKWATRVSFYELKPEKPSA